MKQSCQVKTPIGILCVTEEDGAITGLVPVEEAGFESGTKTELLLTAEKQLEEYFAGSRKEFTLPLRPFGTPFQKRVWEELQKIPYGETRSYEEIAAAVGNPRGCRAVGMANHNNPILLFIPCHRVIGKNGSLTGFGAGLAVKRQLLELEEQNESRVGCGHF